MKYGRAVNHAIELARHIDKVASASSLAYEIELSIDETPQPLGLAQHEAPVYEPPPAEIPLSWDDAKGADS